MQDCGFSQFSATGNFWIEMPLGPSSFERHVSICSKAALAPSIHLTRDGLLCRLRWKRFCAASTI
jgi:hypothetical protein